MVHAPPKLQARKADSVFLALSGQAAVRKICDWQATHPKLEYAPRSPCIGFDYGIGARVGSKLMLIFS